MNETIEIPGAEALTPLGRFGQYGQLFDATFRATDGREIQRIVQIVQLDELDSNQRERVIEDVNRRVSALLQNQLPHVSSICQTGTLASGDYYVMRARHATWLRDSIQNHAGHPCADEYVEQLVEQLLSGLVSLHRAGIAYGDLQLDDIEADGKAVDQYPTLWIAGAEFGGLSHGSNNEIVRTANEHHGIIAPEVLDRRPHEPTPKSDLYALGLLICQLAGGRKILESTSTKARAAKIKSWAVRRLVTHHLLAKESLDCPENADVALRKFQRLKSKQLWHGRRPTAMGAAAALGAFLVAVLVVAVVIFLQRVAAENDAISLLQQHLSEMEQRNAELEREKAVLEQESEPPKSRIHQSEKGSVLPDARQLERDAAQLFKKGVDDRIERDDWEVWLKGEIAEKLESPIAELVATKIATWQARFIPRRTYPVRIDQATTDGNEEENFRLTVYVDGTEVAREYLDAGRFKAPDRPVLHVPWQAGQTIQLILEGDWYSYRPWRANLIDKTFSGPYALWAMHKEGQLIKHNGTTLRFEIGACPGPPRTLFKPIDVTSKPVRPQP